MAAAAFAFVMFNLWYGVIPHQWITLADNEWGWRPDRILYGPGGFLSRVRRRVHPVHDQLPGPSATSSSSSIYGIGLTLQVWHWAQWQNRAKPKAEVVPTTTYGRPLARKS